MVKEEHVEKKNVAERRLNARISGNNVLIDVDKGGFSIDGRLRHFAHFVETTVFVLDANFRVEWMNEQVEKNIREWEMETGRRGPKRSRNEIVGESWFSFIQGREREEMKKAKALMDEGKVVYQVSDIDDIRKSQCKSSKHLKVITIFFKKGNKYYIVSLNLTRAFKEMERQGVKATLPRRKLGVIDGHYIHIHGESVRVDLEEVILLERIKTQRTEGLGRIDGKEVVSNLHHGEGFREVRKSDRDVGGRGTGIPKKRKEVRSRGVQRGKEATSKPHSVSMPSAAKGVMREKRSKIAEQQSKIKERFESPEKVLPKVDERWQERLNEKRTDKVEVVERVVNRVEPRVKNAASMPKRKEKGTEVRSTVKTREVKRRAEVMTEERVKERIRAKIDAEENSDAKEGEIKRAQEDIVRPFTLKIEMVRRWKEAA